MKRALLIGVRDDARQPLDPAPSVAAMGSLLDRLGAWETARLEGHDASREGILDALDRFRRSARPGDDCLIYVVGHGGVISFTDLPPPMSQRPVFYLAAARPSPDRRFEVILDTEISSVAADVDRAGASLSLVLDCCHSTRIVRGPWIMHPSPEWIRPLIKRDKSDDDLLAPENHPGVVRLIGASSWTETFAQPRAGAGRLGRLTKLFVEVTREALPAVDRLTWDALTHRVREQASWPLRCDKQWVTLAGPKRRILFGRQAAELPWTVGFVPWEGRVGGWIRAGSLQGVEPGDEWGIAKLTLDEQLRPRFCARMRVTEVTLDHAKLEPIGQITGGIPPGASAHFLEDRERTAQPRHHHDGAFVA